MTRLIRYGLASLGPIGSAGAQFLLSLILLRALDRPHFGSFSFLLVASQFTTGVWSALFCAPLLVLMTRNGGDQAAVRSIFSTNLLSSIAAGALFFAMGLALDLTSNAAMVFAVAAGVGLSRWFGRAHAYAIGAPLRAMSSDLVYAAILLVAAAGLRLVPRPSEDLAFLALLIGSVAGLLPLGMRYFNPQFRRFSLSDVAGYKIVWREHSGWSLIGVISTEATMNCQAYLVTLFYGPTAFAPIAATSLLIRPVMVATNALTDFERAQMARHIGAGEIEQAARATSMFRWVLVFIVAVTAIASASLLIWVPRLVFPTKYTLPVLAFGAISWFAVACVRAVRAPESALLQAAGEFKTLAWASIYASLFSIASVLAILAVGDPLWSVPGILTGEIAFAFWIWAAVRRWKRQECLPANVVTGARRLPAEVEMVP